VLGNDVPKLGAAVPELSCEMFVGSGEVDNEDVERLVDELPGDGKGRSGASSSWLGYHQ
jgi:hypothetical protein